MSDEKPKKKHEHKNNDLSEAGRLLGKRGGEHGGPARDAALSHEEKSEIARLGGLAAAAHKKSLKAKIKKGRKK